MGRSVRALRKPKNGWRRLIKRGWRANCLLIGLAILGACDYSTEVYIAAEGDALKARKSYPLKLVAVTETNVLIEKQTGYEPWKVPARPGSYYLGNGEDLVLLQVDPIRKTINYRTVVRNTGYPLDF